MDRVNLNLRQIDPEVIATIPGEIAWLYRVIPIEAGRRVIGIAVGEKTRLDHLDYIESRLRTPGKVVKAKYLAPNGQICRALNKYYPLPRKS